jgi:hypothetical protein
MGGLNGRGTYNRMAREFLTSPETTIQSSEDHGSAGGSKPSLLDGIVRAKNKNGTGYVDGRNAATFDAQTA